MEPGDCRIILMDDEPYIRAIFEKMVTKFGYRIDLTENGKDAVDCYRTLFEKQTPADLVILDLSVPGGMGGEEASKEILKINPLAKIIISTGDTSDPLLANFEDKDIKALLPKPFRLQELKQTLQDVLNT